MINKTASLAIHIVDPCRTLYCWSSFPKSGGFSVGREHCRSLHTGGKTLVICL